ncbi:alpha-N-arabinofuranosidase [Alteromonas sp. AMM-1]|uniref:alpha-N-arabinofuranosidase n=1 Tax=Alteromonas sp. AMM-1 TaxID=3394233 RepID=UPI0039A4363C
MGLGKSSLPNQKSIAILLFNLACLCWACVVQANTQLDILSDTTGPVINRDIFGQFSEHIGEGIYGGIWVGRDSSIANVNGIRSDVVNALRELNVPVLRWPGGCFADQYHWRDGIGAASERVSRINGWGNVIETNQFGSDEFMELAKQIGSEAYISVNVGSGSVAEAADWLEYLTADIPTTLVNAREKNGHPEPYRVKYLGLGNEAWGCGGAMSAEEYFARLKPYSVLALNHHPQQRFSGIDLLFNHSAQNPDAMIRVAAGPNDNDVAFTESLMRAWAAAPGYLPVFDAMSLHHYTMSRGPMSDSSIDFSVSEYLKFMHMAYQMDDILQRHIDIMDKYDPKKQVALVVDEWGNWLKPELSENPMFLKQQNSLRDALTAAITLNTFMRKADRVKMANIAQMVNVIQSMILTRGKEMVLTPTYYLYKMYKPFQGATLIPLAPQTESFSMEGVTLPRIDTVLARDTEDNLWLSVVNLHPHASTAITLPETLLVTQAKGYVLTADNVNAINTFNDSNQVVMAPVQFSAANEEALLLTLPAKSVSVFKLVTGR